MRLIEPLGLLRGDAAREAVRDGLALPLAGGPCAFSLVRLIGGGHSGLMPVRDIPADWAAERETITRRPAPWAGLPDDRPLIMGILNVTPDSFSDGGRHASPEAAIAIGRAMAGDGADLIDVGGESTRPGASSVAPEEEMARVLPVVSGLARAGLRVSIDTRDARVMEAALDAGAAIVNDVSALSHDPQALPLIARRGCPVVLMHMRGTPATMNSLAQYGDVAAEVTAELGARLDAALAAGIDRANIMVDPGLGFAKDAGHSVTLLRRLPVLCNLGCRIVAGLSRKSFVGRIATVERAGDRDAASVAAGTVAVLNGAVMLRVHDVRATVQSLRALHSIAS